MALTELQRANVLVTALARAHKLPEAHAWAILASIARLASDAPVALGKS